MTGPQVSPSNLVSGASQNSWRPGGAAPPGAPPDGPPFQSALDEHQARTATAEGQRQSPNSSTPDHNVSGDSRSSGGGNGSKQSAKTIGHHAHRTLATIASAPAAAVTAPASASSTQPQTTGQLVSPVAATEVATTTNLPQPPTATSPGEVSSPALASATGSSAGGNSLASVPASQNSPLPAGQAPSGSFAGSTSGDPDTTSTLPVSALTPSPSGSPEAPLPPSGTAGSVSNPTGPETPTEAPPAEAPATLSPADAGQQLSTATAESGNSQSPIQGNSPSPTSELSTKSAAAPGTQEASPGAQPTPTGVLAQATSYSTALSGSISAQQVASDPTTTAGAGAAQRATGKTSAAIAPAPSPAPTPSTNSLATAAPLNDLPASPPSASSTPSPAAPASYGVDLAQTIEAVHATIELATRQGLSQARIALQPAELGEIRIHLSQTSEGLRARVTADTPAAAQALADGHSELRQSLSSLGLSLLHLDIASSEQFGAQSQDGRSPEQARDSRGTARSSASETAEESDPTPEAEASTSDVGASTGALVDVLA
jgi:flagellar hook-length control protein FliK